MSSLSQLIEFLKGCIEDSKVYPKNCWVSIMESHYKEKFYTKILKVAEALKEKENDG